MLEKSTNYDGKVDAWYESMYQRYTVWYNERWVGHSVSQSKYLWVPIDFNRSAKEIFFF